jgi:oxaloacetate decarboxylase alpha subunit
MFPKVAPKFFKEREKGPVTFEAETESSAASSNGGSYVINVNGTDYNVVSGPAGDTMSVNVNGTAYNVAFKAAGSAASAAPVASGGATIAAPVAGTLLKHVVADGAQVKTGQTVIMIESMKMELEVKATADGPVHFRVQPGTQISAGQELAVIGSGAPVAASAAPAANAAPAAAAAASGGVGIPAPVAGTLLKHVASEGSSVSVGQTVIIIESMKMELEIKATAAGTVHFLAAPGTQISAGQLLAEIK